VVVKRNGVSCAYLVDRRLVDPAALPFRTVELDQHRHGPLSDLHPTKNVLNDYV